jgi:hypothetical protein
MAPIRSLRVIVNALFSRYSYAGHALLFICSDMHLSFVSFKIRLWGRKIIIGRFSKQCFVLDFLFSSTPFGRLYGFMYIVDRFRKICF